MQPVAAQIKEPVIVLMRDGSGDFGLMKGFRPAQGEIESFRDQRLGVGRYETRYRDVMRRRAEAEGIGGVEEGAERSVQAILHLARASIERPSLPLTTF